MVAKTDARLDATFRALSDPTRRAILVRLAQGESTAGELGRPFGISQPAVSKHLKALENARLVRRSLVGRHHRFRLQVEPLEEAAKWLSEQRRFWESALDSLEEFLTDTDDQSTTRGENDQ